MGVSLEAETETRASSGSRSRKSRIVEPNTLKTLLLYTIALLGVKSLLDSLKILKLYKRLFQ